MNIKYTTFDQFIGEKQSKSFIDFVLLTNGNGDYFLIAVEINENGDYFLIVVKTTCSKIGFVRNDTSLFIIKSDDLISDRFTNHLLSCGSLTKNAK